MCTNSYSTFENWNKCFSVQNEGFPQERLEFYNCGQYLKMMQETHWGIWTLRQDKGVVPWLTKGSRQEKGSWNMKSIKSKYVPHKYTKYTKLQSRY